MAGSTWTLFDYTSGSNPYIAKTEAERVRVIAKYEMKGVKVEELHGDFALRHYVIHDRKEN